MKAAWGVWDYIKNRAPQRDEAKRWALEWLGAVPGKRENRRYEGLHILTQHDVRAQGRFDDTIAYGGWTMDDHHPAGLLYPGKPTVFHPAPSPYGIPYRCLVSRNVSNLMFAGRNISVTHAALSSTRVMATCALLGQAAGTGASLAVKHGLAPASIYPDHVAPLQQWLMEDDCYLPRFARAADPINRRATLDADATLLDGHDRPIGDADHAWVGKLGKPITLTFAEPTDVAAVRLVFDSNLNYDKRMPCSYPQRADRSAMPKSLVRAYRVEALRDGAWQTTYRTTDNCRRLVVAPVGCCAHAVRVVPERTWGDRRVRLFGFEALAADPGRLPSIPDGPTWSQVVGQVDPADLAPPDSGLEEKAAVKGHSA